MTVTVWRRTHFIFMPVLLASLLPSLATASVLTDIEVHNADNGTVNVDLRFTSGVPELHSYRLDAPPRVVLDLADTQNGLTTRRLEIGRDG
ncbi:unnamed protein product, partial [Ectocarpus sp. 12 AP-2014]